jgi:hypothetical protein
MESQIVVETCVPKYPEFMNGNGTIREWLKRALLNMQMTYARTFDGSASSHIFHQASFRTLNQRARTPTEIREELSVLISNS